MNIKQKAQNYSDLFTSKTREDGTHYVVVALKGEEGYNEQLSEAIRLAHGDRFPDDWIYGTFADLMSRITDYDVETIDKLEEVRSEIVDSYVDVYTSQLTQWLNSNNRNVYYLTEALEEYEPKDGFELLSLAQYKAIDEVMTEVINLLAK